jgi:BirA family transcriptional regulator, biotin operon repressor / biotin---[acetyl-CoA-carboxylase] ligase
MIPHDEWQLPTKHVGRRVLHFGRLDSTSTFALAHAGDVAHDGLGVLADEQTAGRGQHGRSWTSPTGSSVLLSLLLFPPPALRRPAILTTWAAVSVCELILAETGLHATIKWPNDVLIQERKVCGILIEQAHGTVVGIGLNVNQPAEHFAAAGLTQAASLAVFTGQQRDSRQIARRLIAHLDDEYERLGRDGRTALEACWKGRLGLLGQQVIVETVHGFQHGRLRDVTFEAVEIVSGTGAVLRLAPETVKHLLPGSA